MYLTCKGYLNNTPHNKFSSYKDIELYEKENSYIDFFIRQEALEPDFCNSIEHIYHFSPDELKLIYNTQKTNSSSQGLPLPAYYDEFTTELVRKKERLIIEKFNYSPSWQVG
jgi:hypothetical protein